MRGLVNPWGPHADCVGVLCSRVEVATCSVHGTWYLWDIKLRRAIRTGNCAGAASIVRFTPHIHTLTPPRPLLVSAHWSAQKRESSVHLWDVFDPECGRGTAAGATGSTPGTAGLWHSFMSVAGGQVQDVAFTVDSSAEEDKVLMALAALDGSLVVLDLAARSVMTHMTGGHTDANRTPPAPPAPPHRVLPIQSPRPMHCPGVSASPPSVNNGSSRCGVHLASPRLRPKRVCCSGAATVRSHEDAMNPDDRPQIKVMRSTPCTLLGVGVESSRAGPPRLVQEEPL